MNKLNPAPCGCDAPKQCLRGVGRSKVVTDSLNRIVSLKELNDIGPRNAGTKWQKRSNLTLRRRVPLKSGEFPPIFPLERCEVLQGAALHPIHLTHNDNYVKCQADLKRLSTLRCSLRI